MWPKSRTIHRQHLACSAASRLRCQEEDCWTTAGSSSFGERGTECKPIASQWSLLRLQPRSQDRRTDGRADRRNRIAICLRLNFAKAKPAHQRSCVPTYLRNYLTKTLFAVEQLRDNHPGMNSLLLYHVGAYLSIYEGMSDNYLPRYLELVR